jgi:hypothetical protein
MGSTCDLSLVFFWDWGEIRRRAASPHRDHPVRVFT